MSVKLILDPASVDQAVDYLDQARERILAAIRSAMLEAMQGLAGAAAEQSLAAGIQRRSGDLIEAIEESPRVTETAQLIRGTVASDVGAKHIGLWLEEGTRVPEVAGTLFEFTEPEADTLYSRGHRAFDVKPHTFLNPALHEYETTITDLIQRAVDEAIAA